MMYKRVGRSGLKLPIVSLGLWHNFGGVDSIENMRRILQRAFDLGITHFDLANNYGHPPGSAEKNSWWDMKCWQIRSEISLPNSVPNVYAHVLKFIIN